MLKLIVTIAEYLEKSIILVTPRRLYPWKAWASLGHEDFAALDLLPYQNCDYSHWIDFYFGILIRRANRLGDDREIYIYLFQSSDFNLLPKNRDLVDLTFEQLFRENNLHAHCIKMGVQPPKSQTKVEWKKLCTIYSDTKLETAIISPNNQPSIASSPAP